MNDRGKRRGRSAGGPSISAPPISIWPTTTGTVRRGESEFGRILATDFASHRHALLVSTKAGYEM
jgi:hypothetical protein